LKFAGQKETIN
jgi:signal transduction histidine kinase